MTLPSSRQAYQDCMDAFERAAGSEKGIRLWFAGGRPDASHFRLRMNQLRKLEREANKKTYGPDHPQYGTTIYDTYVIRIKDPHPDDGVGAWLYIEPNTAIPAEVEEL